MWGPFVSLPHSLKHEKPHSRSAMATGALTPKQSAFVAEYLIDLNATQAAIRAGYSENGASVTGVRLLGNPKIAEAVQQGQSQRAKRVELTADYVLSNLTEVVERCMQRAPVMVRVGREMQQAQDDEGRDVWQFDAKNSVSALNLLGQHLGMYTKKVEHSGEIKGGNTVNGIDLDNLTTEQLAVLMQRIAGQRA